MMPDIFVEFRTLTTNSEASMTGERRRNSHTNSMRISVIAIIATIVSPVAAQEPTSPTLAMDGWPEWLIEGMAAESPGLEAFSFEIPDRGFSGNLIGEPLSEPQDIDIGWYISTDIGSGTPMECWVLTSAVDPASMALNIADVSMNAVAETSGALADQFVYYIDGGVIGEFRYLAFEKLYTVGDVPNRVMGHTKVRIAIMDGLKIACGHNQIGYRETFARGFERLVTEAEFERLPVQPFLRQIIRSTMQDQVIGVLETSYAIDEDGDLAISTVDSSLVPVDGATVMSSDSFEYSFWKPDGELINVRSASSSNGELDTNLDLSLSENGGYTVSGEFQGKELQAEIETDDRILSDVDLMLETQRMIADPERNSMTAKIWEPSADPTRLLEATLQFEPDGRDELKVIASFGPMNMRMQMDEYGNLLNGSMKMGAITVAMERIAVVGESPTIETDE